MLVLKIHEIHLESSLSGIAGWVCNDTSQAFCGWLQMGPSKYANCMINELLQSSMQVAGPFIVRWHVLMTNSWPNKTPKGFQIRCNIQVLGVVPWTQDHCLLGIAYLQAMQVAAHQGKLPLTLACSNAVLFCCANGTPFPTILRERALSLWSSSQCR